MERDGGSVSTALEGEQKAGLTGEPVRIDRPTSSCQRELIWHQQSLCVKQGKGQEDPHVQSAGRAAASVASRRAPLMSAARTDGGGWGEHEDAWVIIFERALMFKRRARLQGESFLTRAASNGRAIPINQAADSKARLTFGGLIIKIRWSSIPDRIRRRCANKKGCIGISPATTGV